MKTYECGLSVADNLRRRLPGKITKVCVLDNYMQLTLEQAFDAMLDNIGRDKGVIDKDRLSISSDKETFTLAHEISYDKHDNKIVSPANILRHVYSRDFTYQTLYIDNGEIVDIASASEDIINRQLKCQNSFRKMMLRDSSIITKVLYISAVHNWTLGRDILGEIRLGIPRDVEPITGSDVWIKKMCEQGAIKTFLSILNNSNALHHYFYNRCGLKESISFVPPTKPVDDYDAPIDIGVDPMPRAAFKPGTAKITVNWGRKEESRVDNLYGNSLKHVTSIPSDNEPTAIPMTEGEGMYDKVKREALYNPLDSIEKNVFVDTNSQSIIDKMKDLAYKSTMLRAQTGAHLMSEAEVKAANERLNIYFKSLHNNNTSSPTNR